MNPEIFWQLTEAYRAGVYHQVDEDVLTEEEYFSIQEWVTSLIDEGYDLDDYTDDELYEVYLDEVKGFGGFIPKGGTDYASVYKKPGSHDRNESPASRRGREARELFRGGRGKPGAINNTYASQGVRSRTAIDDRQMQPDTRTRDTFGPRDAEKSSGLSMSPSQRAELAAKRAERQGQRKRANKIRSRMGMSEEFDLYDVISDYLVQEKYCNSYEDADVIMANMSDEWRDEIIEATVMSVTSPEGKKRPLNVAKAKPARNIQDTNPVMKQIRDKKREQEGSSFSPTAERRAKTRSQPQISASRQMEVDRRAPFIARRLMQKYGLSPSDFS